MELNKIKAEIKQWEKEFFNTNNRLPKGSDIYNAPDDIKNKYRIYKTEKQKNLKVQKDLNDPWSLRINKYPNEKENNKETEKFAEKIRCNIKVMLNEKKEELPKLQNIIDKEINIKDTDNHLKEKMFNNSCNIQEKLSERKIIKIKHSFTNKASEINVDRLLNPDIEKQPSTVSPWETEFAANNNNTPCPKIDLNPSEHCENLQKKIKNNNSEQDFLEPIAKKYKVDKFPNTTATKAKPTNNFVKLNLKFKSFCGKATAKQKSLRNEIKRTKWNNKMSSFRKCYNCGEEGHYSNKCTKRKLYGPRDEKSEIKALGFNDIDGVVKITDFQLQNIENFTSLFNRTSFFHDNNLSIEKNTPKVDADDLEECLTKALKIFRFDSFRSNQEKVIRRICSGKSTLAVMPTGSGKSLCYQIPAYIFQQTKGSVALIISPLISLMEDQISKLPKEVKGIALNSTLKYDVKMKVLAEINKLEYAFVLISPEALVESNWLSPDKLPPISFVCIDEVHCLSDWSHHFRPSYLRVCKLLRERYNVGSFLGLSATCTSRTIDNIAKYLKLDINIDPESCVRNIPIPDNIIITVSESEDKEYSLIKMLQQQPFSTCSSILIYCSTREETTEIATLISIKLRKIEVIVGKKKLPWSVEAYHAGLTLPKRSRLQKQFMKGKIRVLVATVAFGMGLDKSDLRAVIHYSRPRSFENYVQEIGRVGRDGLPSYAHVLMVSKEFFKNGEDEELNDLHRHTYANHVEEMVLKNFIRSIFPTERKCEKGSCHGHIHGIRPSEVAVNLNVREETLMTLLCYLELFENVTSLKILPANYRYLKLNCYRGPKQMAELSHKSIAISTLLTMKHLKKEVDLVNTKCINLDMIESWENTGLEVAVLRKELKTLEWSTSEDREGTIRYFRSGVANEFTDWHWIIAVRCDLDELNYEKIYTHLYDRLNHLENDTINDMDDLHNLFRSNSSKLSQLYSDKHDEDLNMKSNNIRKGILLYFNNEERKEMKRKEYIPYTKSNETELRNNIRAFITQYKTDNTMSARAIASVFHGINCPMFPSIYWASQKRYWRCALNVDFLTIMKWANEELRFLL